MILPKRPPRRTFITRGLASVALTSILEGQALPTVSARNRVLADRDRLGEKHMIGVSLADFKVSSSETKGGLFVMENKYERKGGPPRHYHRNEDEWIYVLEGTFIAEIDGEQFTLGPGDSSLILRRKVHAYAFTGAGKGRVLVAFSPGGEMEESFRSFQDRNGAYTRWDDPKEVERARRFGMEMVGPPLSV